MVRPCRASFPALGKINAEYAPRGVVLVGVVVDEKASAYAAFVKQAGAAVSRPPRRPAAARPCRESPGDAHHLPDWSRWQIRSIHSGYHGDATDKLLRTELDALLAEKS